MLVYPLLAGEREQVAPQVDFSFVNAEFFTQVQAIKLHSSKADFEEFRNILACQPLSDKICYLNFPWRQIGQLRGKLFTEGRCNVVDIFLHKNGV